MRNLFRSLALSGIVCLLIMAQPIAAASLSDGETAPDFTLIDQNGRTVSLSDYTGKVVVLEWINPDCPFVKRHYKSETMKKLAEKYKTSNVVWLAINSTHYMGKEDNKKWSDQFKLPYPILVDKDGRVGNAYGARTTPHMYVIDTSGRIVYQGAIDDDPRGSSDKPDNYVDDSLREVLGGKTVTVDSTKPYGCSVKYAKK
jgi:peroxiredoxin